MQKNVKKDSPAALKLLKIILWIYIILCIIIAGLNYGYAKKAPAEIAHIILWIWLIYENWVKALFIMIGSFLSIKIIGSSKRTAMRKRNLTGFILAALAVHVIAPFILNNYELYCYAMPLPWTTVSLKLLDSSTSLYRNTVTVWGPSGILTSLVFFVCASFIVLIGTLLFGRRFQCSSICLFNGFASEVFDPAMPLIGKRKKAGPKTLRILNIARWIALTAALFFTFYWILHLLGFILPGNIDAVTKIESYAYLSGDLLLMMFLWIAFLGRGYCYYCPLGTVLSLLSRIAGQKITTDNTKCISCKKCDKICPMAIEISEKAARGISVNSIRCVGCGHCVDECPTQNLRYSTGFLDRIAKN